MNATGESETFHYEEGIRDFIQYLNEEKIRYHLLWTSIAQLMV